MINDNYQNLLELVKRKYKSLNRPDFSFVQKAISSNPYNKLICSLRALFTVEELTDTNDDVCFRYMVSKGSNEWIIELSMLGPYAVVFKICDSFRTSLVPQDSTELDEMSIISLLHEHQLRILNIDELERPVALTLYNTEAERVCLYQALFSDVDILPWRT